MKDALESLATRPGGRLGILMGGGPAPGINGVIRAATLEAISMGLEVYGIREGYRRLVQGNSDHVVRLRAEDVASIHLRGGSILGTSRESPTRDDERLSGKQKLANTAKALEALGIGYLVTIGGDDTATSAARVGEYMSGTLRFAHVPKTIDNDLPLPDGLPTFGYHSARQVATDLVANLVEDARTTGRWYFVVAMGRSAGHLALGIGKAVGADITLIPEEFRGETIRFETLVRILEGAIFKRKAAGQGFGVAVVAEGVAECVSPKDLSELSNAERDEHGHVRLAELPFGVMLKDGVRKSLATIGHRVTIVDKNIGYEVRCASPVAFDLEYTQDLGCAAVRLMLAGESGILVCVRNGEIVPLPLDSLRDKDSGRMGVRRVDVDGPNYRLARTFMARLGPSDFEGPLVTRLIEATGMAPQAFHERYGAQAQTW